MAPLDNTNVDTEAFFSEATPSPLDTPLPVTRFPNEKATFKTECVMTLRELADFVGETHAASKRKLPFVKLARFSGQTDNRCLRADDLLTGVYGAEVDYDGDGGANDTVTPEQARDIFKKAGIAVLVVTTPSHGKVNANTGGRQNRWRGFFAFRDRHEGGGLRYAAVAAVNGLLEGKLASESFTASQAYYIGNEDGRDPVTSYLVDGRFLDLVVPEIISGAVGRYNDTGHACAVTWREHATAGGDLPQVDPSERGHPIARAALAKEARMLLAELKTSGGHDMIRAAAMRLGKYIKAGAISQERAVSVLMRVARRNGYHEKGEAYVGQIASLIVSGAKKADPWCAPGEEFDGLLATPETAEQTAEAERQTRKLPDAEVNPTPGGIKSAPLGDIGTLAWWERRALTEPVRLLGSFITLPAKVWLSGQTGLGKSMFAMGAAIGIATGAGFLHWTCERPARVLYLDGEMGARAVRARLIRAAQERGGEIGDRLRVFSPDDMDDLAHMLGQRNAPLNTEAGRRFVIGLADYVGAEVIIVDNLMAFCAGDLKDTAVWQETKPLVDHWHKQGKAQLWLDHTGRDGARQYGDTTKRWGFETAGVLLALGKVRVDEIHATLTFSAEHEGKHRHRTSSNWEDFSDHEIHLENGVWRSVAREAVQVKNPEARAVVPERKSKAMHEVLLKMLPRPGASVSRQAWFAACEAAGVLATRATTADPSNDDEGDEDRKAKKRNSAFRHGLSDLKHCGWVHQPSAETFKDSRHGVVAYKDTPDDEAAADLSDLLGGGSTC